MERSSNPLGLLWGHSPQREELQTSGIVMGTQPSGRGVSIPTRSPFMGTQIQGSGLQTTGILMGT